MRHVLIASLVLGGLLAGGNCAHAGIYNLSAEKEIQDIWPLAMSYPQIKLYLASLRACDDRLAAQQPDKKPDRLRVAFLAQLAQLQAKQKVNALCTLDRVDLGACLIRLGRNTEAAAILEKGLSDMAADDPARFLILANLATAWHNQNEQERAIGYQEQALAAWPTNWPGWGLDRTLSYRRIERYYLELLRQRSKEMGRWTTVDDLFPGVKFDDPKEKYQAGSIAPKMFDRLPTEAPIVVLQLLIWQPSDERLLWLYGEILNARGEIVAATDIFKELVSARGLGNIPVLISHRKELVAASEKLHEFLNIVSTKPFLAQQMLTAFHPRGGLFSPGIGSAMNEGTFLMGPVVFRQWLIDDGNGKGRELKPQSDNVPLLLDWRQIIVSFFFGVLAAVLVRQQVLEWRRRGVGLASRPEPAEPELQEQSAEPAASGGSEMAPTSVTARPGT